MDSDAFASQTSALGANFWTFQEKSAVPGLLL